MLLMSNHSGSNVTNNSNNSNNDSNNNKDNNTLPSVTLLHTRSLSIYIYA